MSQTAQLDRQHEGSTIPVAGTYVIDPSHSRVSFWVRHMMVAKVRGQFAPPTGTFVIAEDPLESRVALEVDWSTIDTGDANRDAHLKSADFIDAEKNATLRFESTGVEHVKGDQWRLTGDLTVNGVTNPIGFDLEVNGVGRDPYGNVKAGFTASTVVDRGQFGVTWNAALETGGFIVGNDVHVEVDVEAALQQ